MKNFMVAANEWQHRHRWFAVPWAVQQKFGTDQANMWVVALGWYGFLAIYPTLLAVVTIFGFIGVGSLGSTIVNTLHRFPVIGTEFSPGSGGSRLHGSVFGLVIGLGGLVYGAQGVTQTAQAAMNRVWNVPKFERPGFLPRLGRSLAALIGLGLTFVVNAVAGSWATGSGRDLVVRVGIIAGQVVLNALLYLLVFRLLLAPGSNVQTRSLWPGAIAGGVGFTLLITVGTGLVTHQLRNESAVYGAFASVIGVVAFLLLLAKLSLYSAELNPVLALRLYPRALPMTDPLPADLRNLEAIAQEERRTPDERIVVETVAPSGDGADDAAPDRAAEKRPANTG